MLATEAFLPPNFTGRRRLSQCRFLQAEAMRGAVFAVVSGCQYQGVK